MKDKDKPIPMTKEEEYRNADVPMPEEEVYGQAQQVKLRESYKQSLANREERISKEEITSRDYYAPGSSWIQDQEEYNGAKAYSAILKLFFKGKK